MFNNRFRFLKILATILILGGLVFYAQRQGPKVIPGFREFQKNPSAFINRELAFGGKIKKLEEDSFQIEQISDGEKTILKINGRIKKAKLEDTIYGVAVYKADKSLSLDRYIISNSRPIKIIVSFIALVGVFLLFFRDFSFDFKKFIFTHNA